MNGKINEQKQKVADLTSRGYTGYDHEWYASNEVLSNMIQLKISIEKYMKKLKHEENGF